MCGIAGIFCGRGAAPPSLDELRDMGAMLSHRGPDGCGLYRDERLGLAHVRLSLIDLAGGFQPIHNGDGSLWLCFNGEIFNYIELRGRLAALGHRFYTDGDSEVIVHCYQEYGAAAWEMLNGQFAFALWDRPRHRLWLVRDRLGILPLYHARAGDRLLFASEAKALFAGGQLAPSFDAIGLGQTFSCWSVSAPRTVFAGVCMVRPGSALCFSDDLAETDSRYWQPDPGRLNLDRLSADEAADALEDRLGRAVALRLRADVPVGAYLSGGLDSGVIGALAKDRAGDCLESFGIRFADPRFDETAEQRVVVDWLGTRHHEIVCDGAAIRDSLDDVVWHCETPLLRTAPVPLYQLARCVREAGMRTVLTGEGADELLAGYSIFKEDQIRRFWARDPASRLRPALLSRIHHYVGGERARTTAMWRNFFGRDLALTDHPFYSHLIRWRNTAWTLRFLSPAVRQAFDLDAMMADAAEAAPAGWRDWDPLQRASWTEIATFMSTYLLACQGDRVAMAHGVEARYPFLDPDVVDFCLALPKRCKLIGLRDKLALRRLGARRLPPSVAQRRKQPFRAPIAPALLGDGCPGGFDWMLSKPALERIGLVDVPAVGHLIAKACRNDPPLSEREEMGLLGILSLSLLSRQFGADFQRRVREARVRYQRMACHVLVDRLAGTGATSNAIGVLSQP